MDSREAREEHEAELSSRPETAFWDALRKTQSAVSNGFIHRWASRQIPKGALVLDAACGDGRLARVRGDGAPTIGFDFVERLASRARRFTGGAPVGVADVHSMPVKSTSIDFLTCFEVLEHLEDPDQAVSEFARILRPGGRLFLSVPNDEGLKHRLKRDPHPLHHGAMTTDRIRTIVSSHLRLDVLAYRGVWLFTPGRVSVQVGLPASRRVATNILVVATRA
jgi:2-polyprenyl-3-methyl-5-hydroxy-6-metoxy-1,4-benzoquinol methylase